MSNYRFAQKKGGSDCSDAAGTGLFLSPDPILQAPMNPLNFNRYTYVLNNPLKYTDPSGYRRAEFYGVNVHERPWFGGSSLGSGGGGGHLDPLTYLMNWDFSYTDNHFYNTSTGESMSSDNFFSGPGSGLTKEVYNATTGEIDHEFFNFTNDLARELDGSDFSIGIAYGYGKLWVTGMNKSDGMISSYGAVNNYNFRSYGEAVASYFNQYTAVRYEFTNFEFTMTPQKGFGPNGSAFVKGFIQTKQINDRWYVEAFASVIPVNPGTSPDFWATIKVYQNGNEYGSDHLNMNNEVGANLYDSDWTRIGWGRLYLPESGDVLVQFNIGSSTMAFWRGCTHQTIVSNTYLFY